MSNTKPMLPNVSGTVCTLKLTEKERKWLKWQIVANQKAAGKLIEEASQTDKDLPATKELMETNNSILKKLF